MPGCDVVVQGCEARHLEALVEKLRRKIASTDFGIGRAVTASFGIAELRVGRDDDPLVSRADSALYEAKNSGRNKVCAARASGE